MRNFYAVSTAELIEHAAVAGFITGETAQDYARRVALTPT